MNEEFRISRKDLDQWIGRPVWYQAVSNVNDFGWCFIHPDTVTIQPGGFPLNFCKLIMPDPNQKAWYPWNEIELYSRPVFHGICRYCKHRRPDQLTRCDAVEKCSHSNRYKAFEPADNGFSWSYTPKTFLKALRLSGYKIKKDKSL